MHKRILLISLFLCLLSCGVRAQETDRIRQVQRRLDSLSTRNTGLNQTVQLLVSGVSIQDYLFALGKVANLSISVDPQLNFIISDTFSGVTASNMLVFLAKKYNLDITVLGSIIYIIPYNDPLRNQKPPPREIRVSYAAGGNALSLELENDSLPAVARKITEVSGRNVVVPDALQGKKVSGFIRSAPFEAAMDKLAFTNSLKVTRTSDDFYLFQPLAENEELYVNGDRGTAVRKAFRPAATGQAGNTGLFSTLVGGKKLISADAVNAPLSELVKQASQELNKSYSMYSEIRGVITLHVSGVTYEDFLGLLFRGTNYTFHAQSGVYMIGENKLEGLRTYKLIKLEHRAIDTVMAMIPTDWKKDVEIKEFREQNTILVSGSAAQIAEVNAFIKELDVLVPVVYIEFTLIDINKSRSVSTGISAGVSDSIKTGGSILPGLDYTVSARSVNSFLNSVGKLTSLNLGHVVPNFYVRLRALEANGDIEVRSVPKMTALNGHTATLSIGNSIYYKNSAQTVIPVAVSTQSIYTNTFVQSDANLEITIKPVVSGDDEVTLNIRVTISDFTAIPTDGSPPPKSTSKFETSLRVHNEDMIVLGGIERTERNDSGSGIPFLSRIPLLKYIFSSRTKSTKKVVSVMYIKPVIIR